MSAASSQYRDIASVIRVRIREGAYERGKALPKEEDLANELEVNRVTVNRAARILAAEGLIRVHRGVGWIVHELPPLPRDAATRHSREARERQGSRGALATELATLGYHLRSNNTVGPGQPPAQVAEILGVNPDADSVVVRARRMFANDVPIQIATSYIPLSIAAGTLIEHEDSGVGGISSRLAELGHAQVEIEECINVRPPAPSEAAFLRMTGDQRVYEITHTGWTADDRPVKVTIYIMPTYQWNLRYRYPVDPADA
ncbi:GntR family transcriptional regulator [Streptosporangium sp. NPDC049078]|uniref:GntR family transcriptional regulator n=1 Tax=Streptosporangium sp. NPDC049078 TaxID=3155767 RepID=UPI00343207BC